jgi:hypothetical protein
MNNMEDKELQELFDAKRTVEANRRRQAALRQLIEARASESSAPAPAKVRRLWPVWTGAAAAAVALLLLTLPALFKSEDALPPLVAETEVPEVRVVEETGLSSTTSPSSLTSPARKVREATPQAQPEEEVLPEATPSLPEPIIEEAPATEETVLPMETVAPSPRVMHRQSTLIACTEGCKTPEGTDETSSRNVQINIFSNDNYADATIYSIPIKK